jgi:hypothetical protein
MVCFYKNKTYRTSTQSKEHQLPNKLGTLLSLPTIRQSPDAVGKQQDKSQKYTKQETCYYSTDKSQQGDGVERMEGKLKGFWPLGNNNRSIFI